jgi:hypothetical protein
VAEFAVRFLVAPKYLINKNAVVDFPLDKRERATVLKFPVLPAELKAKLSSEEASFTIADTARMLLTVAESLLDEQKLKPVKFWMIAQKLADCLEGYVFPVEPEPSKPARLKPTDNIYQFKITLLDIEPPIWRRIQIQDCTLQKLRNHIQQAMGWTNSHHYQFEIQKQCYGDPAMLSEGFDEFECLDSSKTLLSSILSERRKRFAFNYEYDFGDGWKHEILYEGIPPIDTKAKYPICLEGEGACPPEDCGGAWGYIHLLNVLEDPEHVEHRELKEWIGGHFDSEEFDSKRATKDMRNRR